MRGNPFLVLEFSEFSLSIKKKQNKTKIVAAVDRQKMQNTDLLKLTLSQKLTKPKTLSKHPLLAFSLVSRPNRTIL